MHLIWQSDPLWSFSVDGSPISLTSHFLLNFSSGFLTTWWQYLNTLSVPQNQHTSNKFLICPKPALAPEFAISTIPPYASFLISSHIIKPSAHPALPLQFCSLLLVFPIPALSATHPSSISRLPTALFYQTRSTSGEIQWRRRRIIKPTEINNSNIHSWPLNNPGGEGHWPCPPHSPHVQEYECNLWLCKNFTANSTLLTRSLTSNKNGQLTHSRYAVCIIYCILTRK